MDNFNDYEKVDFVGEGGFGEVWQVRTDNGQTLAAKFIDMDKLRLSKATATVSKMTQHEIEILKRLNHQNVVKFVCVRQEGIKCWVIFTEFIDGKDLAHIGKLNEGIAKDYLRQICSGLNYLHTCSPPVLHRDIKGENIMVTFDGEVKLIDFGISMNLLVASGQNVSQVIMTTAGCGGTLPFMAPELLGDRCQFSVKSDVWALGMTVNQMLTGQHPYSELRSVTGQLSSNGEHSSVTGQLSSNGEHSSVTGQHPYGEHSSVTGQLPYGVLSSTTEIIDAITTRGAPPLPAGCSSNLKDFYACCTAMQAEDRWSVSNLLVHPFLAPDN